MILFGIYEYKLEKRFVFDGLLIFLWKLESGLFERMDMELKSRWCVYGNISFFLEKRCF